MSAYGPDVPAVRACRAQDLAGLIGILALLEGELLIGRVPDDLAERLRDRLERVGLGSDLRQALADLHHRLRYALGEYDEPPR